MIGNLLADFFDGAVQVADVGDCFADDLAVGFDHEAQHAVGARMLRPDADRHILGVKAALLLSRFVHRFPIAAVFLPKAPVAC
jgi:hypothetical protein